MFGVHLAPASVQNVSLLFVSPLVDSAPVSDPRRLLFAQRRATQYESLKTFSSAENRTGWLPQLGEVNTYNDIVFGPTTAEWAYGQTGSYTVWFSIEIIQNPWITKTTTKTPLLMKCAACDLRLLRFTSFTCASSHRCPSGYASLSLLSPLSK